MGTDYSEIIHNVSAYLREKNNYCYLFDGAFVIRMISVKLQTIELSVIK